MTITRIVQTCWALPSQWEGFLDDGRALYARFRHGRLYVKAHPTFPLADDAELLLEDFDDDPWAGEMSYERLRDLLRVAGITAPDCMDSDNLFHQHIIPEFQSLK